MKDRSLLAKIILDDINMATCPVPNEVIKETYGSLWERGTSYRGLAGFDSKKALTMKPLPIQLLQMKC